MWKGKTRAIQKNQNPGSCRVFLFVLEQDTFKVTKVLTNHRIAVGSKELLNLKCSWLFGHNKCSASYYYQNSATGKFKEKIQKLEKADAILLHSLHLQISLV